MAIRNVGRLRLLQDLGEFHVQTKRGFELKQLEHLNDLFGTLIIKNLHTIEKSEEAHQAKLSEKHGIRTLQYCWDYGSEDVLRDVDVEILDSLCPPSQLKVLGIEGYSGKRLSNWIFDNGCKIPELEHLELSNCRGVETLQNIRELSNLLYLTLSLSELTLRNCLSLVFGLKKDLEMIMSVRSVLISNMVTFLESYGDDFYYGSTEFQFDHVQEMMKLGDHIDEQACSTISNDLKKCLEERLELICQFTNECGQVYLPPLLQKVSIGSCFITDKVLAKSLQGLKSLTKMELRDIITITCIPERVLSSLTSLIKLTISECLLITSIGGWDTHSTLENLRIGCCPHLTLKTSTVTNSTDAVKLTGLSSCCRTTASSNLNYVLLRGCILADDMFQNLVSLKTIKIWDCPTMVNLHMGSLKSLVDLDLMGCRNLISLRGLNELKDLKKLHISRCQKFEAYFYAASNKLRINRLSLIEQLIPRDALSSLISLLIQDAEEEYFSQQECEVLQYLSSLEEIHFFDCKMRSLPNLQCLQSLRYLEICRCPNITSLSELPPSVEKLVISDCNEEFTRRCNDANDPNWHKISHIPDKYIFL